MLYSSGWLPLGNFLSLGFQVLELQVCAADPRCPCSSHPAVPEAGEVKLDLVQTVLFQL